MPHPVGTILVPVDETSESERALPVGVALAEALGARLELVTVDSPHMDDFGTSLYHRKLLDRVPVALATGSTITSTDESVGVALGAVAEARPGAAVCIATEARNPFAELLLGSVADRLLETDSGPVVLVGPSCDPGWPGGALSGRRMVVALDGTEVDDAVVTAALAWSAALHLEVTFVTVGEAPLPGEPSPSVDALTRAVQAAEAGERQATTRLLAGIDAGAAVLRFVRQAAPALLIVGSHRRGPWARVALGSNALWMVHRAPCPVLVAGIDPRRDAP